MNSIDKRINSIDKRINSIDKRINIREQKINDMVIKPIKFEKQQGIIKGADIIGDNIYPNVFSVAMKNSGKTTNLFNSMKKIISKDTKVYFFVSTFYNDKIYFDIIKPYLDDKEIEYYVYTHIGDELRKLSEMLKLESKLELEKNEQEKNEPPQIQYSLEKLLKIPDDEYYNDQHVEEIKVKIKKPKKISPKYFIVFDDMSEDLRSPYVSVFIKNNRHFKALCWISSQNATDIKNDARNNINIYLLYPNIPEEKLKQIYESATVPLPYDKFISLYNYATEKPHNFLYINRETGEYRKNYDVKLLF